LNLVACKDILSQQLITNLISTVSVWLTAKKKKCLHCLHYYKVHESARLTSQMAFSAVSVPRVKSVPGTLLLIVAGIIVIGMQNSGCLSLASAIISTLW